MAKGFSFEEALQPTTKGFSFEEALPTKPEPILSPEEQMMSSVGQTSGETAKDLAKLTAAGAVKGTLGAPEAIQSGLGATARESLFGATDALNLIADPRALTNKLAGAIGISPIFEEKKLVPAETTAKQKAAVDEVLTKGKIPELKTLTEFGNRLSEDIESSISPEMKLALAESQPTGNILKALETGDFSEVSMGKNPTFLGLSGQAAKVFGSAAPAFLTAGLTKTVGPAAAVGFGQAGAEGVDEARTYIGKMSDEELTKKSEYFRNLVALGYSPKDAREMTIVKAGDTAALYQGTVGALGGAFTNKLLQGAFDKTLLASAKSRLAKIAQGTALGATEGGLSEMAEGVATDLGIDKSVVREIGVDSFANLVLGALGEGAPGTVRGAIARTEAETPEAVKAEVAQAPVVPVEVTPAITPEPAPVAAPVVQEPVQVAPAPVEPARVMPGAIQEEDVEPLQPETVTPVTVAPTAAPAVEAAPQPVAEAPVVTKEVEKALQGVRADEIPLHEFNLGIIDAMNKTQPNPELVSEDALKLLIANELVKQDKNKKLELLPKGNQMLNALRDISGFAKPQLDPDQQKAFFSQFIPQIATGEVVAQPKAEEVLKEEKAATPEISQKLKNLLEGKEEYLKVMQDRGLSPEYAAKAYDAEVEYQKAADRAYSDHPNKISEEDFTAAIKKHSAFTKRVNAVLARKKPTKEEKVEANKERQAEKKAKAEKPSVDQAIEKIKETTAKKAKVELAEIDEPTKERLRKLVDLGRIAERQNVSFERAVDAYKKATDKEKVLENTERNLIKEAKAKLINKSEKLYFDATGKVMPKESQVVDAVKKGLIDISKEDFAKDFYDMFKVTQGKPKEIAGVSKEVADQLTKFEAGVFSDKDTVQSVYNEAAKIFLESPLTAKMPTANQAKIEAKPLKDIQPLSIEKKVVKKADKYEDQHKALLEIAAKKDIRYYLNGIFLDKDNNRMVATDGHRAAVINKANFDGAPQTKAKDYVVGKDGAIIEGKFPDIDRVVPKKHADNVAKIDAKLMGDYAEGVKKAWRYISGKYNPFLIQIGGKVHGFNSDYIVDMTNLFRKMGYDTFQMSIDDGGKLFAVSPDKRVTQVVMGMRDPESPFSVFIPSGEKKANVKESESKKKKPPEEGEFYNNFDTNFTKADLDTSIQQVRDDKISELAGISRRITASIKEVANQGSDLALQARLNYLMEYKQQLKDAIEADKPERRSAEWFRARAAEELAKENIKPEVMAVVDKLYEKYPTILEGLKLSVRQPKQRGVTGNYRPIERLVTVYHSSFASLLTGEAGKKQAATMRHEITHSLEQMMPEAAQRALVDAWADSLAKAIEKNPGKPEQKYFQAVLDFTEKPSESNYRLAVSLMPDYSFYQYMNPSEYWAVNAEKLMKATLGSPWARFVKGVQKLWEAMKSVFGFDNRYAVHREFDRIMKGDQQQMTQTMLADYLRQNKEELTFLNSVEDVDALLEKYDRADTPLHPSGEVKDTILGSYQKAKKIAAKVSENKLMTAVNMVGKVDRAITYARNKNVWFGSGLDQADFARYNGKLKDSQGIAVASVAVTNAIHAGHVGTQVMIQGGLEFDFNEETGKGTQMFRAVKRDYSMANVVRLKHDLEEKLGAQRAANVVNAYFEAKRSRSIIEEFLKREGEYVKALESGETEEEASKNMRNIEVARQKVNMDDEQIDDFIALEDEFPELRKMMDNWTKVNHNMLDQMAFAGVISKKRAAQLKAIKDYVPWYRIMDDQTDIHQAVGVRGMTNVGQEKRFKEGAVDRDIDDIVDNMIHNVMMMTRNTMKNWAANQVAIAYATRKPDTGKIKLYPAEGSDANGVRTNIIMNGRRVVVNFPDPLVAEAVLGMENIEIPMIDILAFFANGLRRGITTFPVFQVSQLFMDAPTAALVSGVKKPFALMGSTFGGFIQALKPQDDIVQLLKSYGIGGYQSSARTPEKELKLEIGLLDKSVWAKAMKTLDHIGDASDYAQRRAIYKQVLKETGDEMQALIQANNVIDFLKRGSGKGAQFVTRTVSFMNAYAQSIDVLATAIAGGGLKGKSRKAAQAQMIKTGMLLAGTTLLYCMAVGADDEYDKLDDQTKLRNIIIPGTKIRLPMHTSASFFFKAIPELIYNKVMKEGTKNQIDNTRLRKALGEAAIDSLLGPNMIPTGIKPVAEIALNHNFFTGGTLTPKGMEKLESFRQYTSSTSELGKVMSALTMGALNPIEADHLMRGLFGTAGAAVMYGSNLFSGDRVAPQAKDNPLYGSFILPDVPRGREDLFYDLKERSDKKYETFVDLMKKQRTKEGQQFREENKALINAHGFVTQADADLKRINAEIRRLSDLPESKMSSAEKRARITKFQETKNNILEQTIKFRLKADL